VKTTPIQHRLPLVGLAFAAIFGLLSFAAPDLAHAQTTGSISGTAEDVNGAPVSGIKIKVSSKNLIGGAREQLTKADGSFRFADLPPGDYSIEASAKNFAPQVAKGLRLSIGENIDLTLLMEVKTNEEVIRIRAKPLVDLTKLQSGLSIKKEFLEEIPNGRDYQGTAQFLPGVTGDRGNPTINGGSAYSNQYLVDGMNTTDPTTNTFNLNFNFDAIEEVEIITGGFSPEYGNVSGGVINVVTRSGSNDFELDASLYYTSDAFMLEGLDESPRDFSSIQANFNVGGPIVKDLLWFFVSAEFNHSSSQLPRGSSVSLLADTQHPARLFESMYWLLKLTSAPSKQNRVTLLLQGDPTIIDNSDQDSTSSADTETHQDQGGVLASLRWDGLYDPLVIKLQAGYKYSFLDIFPQKRAKSSSPFRMPGFFGAGALSDKNSFGVARGCLGADQLADPGSFETDGSGKPTKCVSDVQGDPSFGDGYHFDLDSGAGSRGGSSDVFIERTRWQFTGTASYFLDDAGGNHEFKLGFDLALMNDTETAANPGGASIFLDLDLDGDGTPDPYAARITATDDNSLKTSADGLVFAMFLMDTWKLWDNRLVIQPGVRFEQSTYENFAGTPILDFFTVSPRLWFALDPVKDGKTKIHGGYGRLYETGNLALSKFIGRSIATRLAFFDEVSGRYVENPNRVRIQGGEAGTEVDPDLDPMTIDEFQLGIQRAICEPLSFDITYIHRKSTDTWEDDETNLIWNQAGTDVIGSRDGTGQQVFRLTSKTKAERTYDALQLSIIKELDDHWAFNGSYSLSFFKGTSPEFLTGAYDNYRQDVYLNGNLPDDHRHMIKAQFYYQFDIGLTIGLAAQYETGGAFSSLYLNDYDGDYTNRRAARGKNAGQDLNDPSDDRENRLPDFVRIDARASFNLRHLTGVDLEFIAEIFNLLNMGTVTAVESSVTAEGGFGTPLNYQTPFQANIGLRYRL